MWSTSPSPKGAILDGLCFWMMQMIPMMEIIMKLTAATVVKTITTTCFSPDGLLPEFVGPDFVGGTCRGAEEDDSGPDILVEK